ncbi:MAG: UDP-glucose/GDP-mannose dehydrogenase family protein [Chloroflexi bacterium]|jgi:UDPglucose 6-dehydrogenase|uniref:UDP-glucose 6-dehydrogenase n=1 Tax=Candidatus Thermofonsia Clade 3 bacterium TaxID=2364212 RepID=A0A2M8QBD1_9CHLR|nr:UDP-glucose/GDP-mannose dehydrogenase family protein [Candidatus Roseilinea sp. NK_OTU-006]PJF47123.1 MAG: UDP-glucose 6-dehydrogenase [Candidatus Thermofonsia Clade 3 bacterium]RMG65784.1 MAG: UDP-glucose/GDP-mannose dehydrogenase family protein [Chloroflexota bacterium]
MKNIAVIGVGYVGLVTGTCFADLGNRVTCVDVNEERIANLKQGILPIYEPGLEEVVRRNLAAGRLSFTTSYAEALNCPEAPAELVFIAVNTPTGVDGEAELRYVRAAAEMIAQTMDHPLIIVNKSTVPVGTGDWVADIVRNKQPKPIPFSVVSNPEFLREGSALSDFMNPDRIVLGSLDEEAAQKVAQLYLPLRGPIMITDPRTAEMIKYASNAFLATKISFINEIANICEALGADVKEVAAGMGYDKRIGRAFLDAGLGYGGSCFPKDVKALAHMANVQGKHPQLLEAVMQINADARRSIVAKVRALVGNNSTHLNRLEGKTIGVLGLAFKANTDDIRESQPIDIIRMIQADGGTVKAYDPVAMPNAAKVLHNVKLCADAYEVAEGSDALILATEWNEFKNLDLARIKRIMKQPVIVDGRNLYDPPAMRELGFIYRGVGRGY